MITMRPVLKELKENLNKLKRRGYLKPTIKKYEEKVDKLIKEGIADSEAHARILVLDYLTEIMRESQGEVEKIIEEKLKRGLISDPSQTRVAVAGSNFQGLVAYALIQNVLSGNIPGVIIALRPKQSKYREVLERYTLIMVGDEYQKPDVDILMFDPTIEEKPVIIYSCKTSLRERAGQTYKWKLLYEMATTKCKYIVQSDECPIKRYKISFNGKRKVLVGFITADFYNELNSPQLRGMLSFFDFSYVSKPHTDAPNTKKLSEIVGDLNKIFR